MVHCAIQTFFVDTAAEIGFVDTAEIRFLNPAAGLEKSGFMREKLSRYVAQLGNLSTTCKNEAGWDTNWTNWETGTVLLSLLL